MLYELGLLFTIAVCGWLALDPFLSAGRGRSYALGAMAVCAAIWSGAELLLQNTSDAREVWILRRALYLGAIFLPVSWFWLALQAYRGVGRRGSSWLAALCVVPSAFFYSSLFWAPDAYNLYEEGGVTRGPLFLGNLVWSWLLIVSGVACFAAVARRLRHASSGAFLALSTGSAVPLVGNALYLAGMVGPLDPTPILLGLGGLLLRAGVVDAGLASHLPFGRGDLLDQLDAGVLVSDISGEVVVANPAAHRLLREPRLLGGELDALLDQALRHPDRSIEVRRFPLETGMGVVGTGAILTDRTGAERAARRLQLAARLETVGFLTAGIAHEVNNPLAWIRSNLSQLDDLARKIASDEMIRRVGGPVCLSVDEAEQVIAETREGVEQIADLVDRLRSFARQDAGSDEVRPVSFERVAERAAEMARVGFGPDAIRIDAAPSPPVAGIETQLIQIVLNLLVNALQASDDEPDIDVVIGPRAPGVLLEVWDRGSGISDEALPHLFDPFFTTKPPGKGTGLGLSLSYDLARQHGGRLSADRREGGGAVFRLWIPAAEEGEPAAAPEGGA